MSTYRAAGVKNLDSVKGGLLGNTVGLCAHGACNVSSMAIAVRVASIAGIVGKEGSTTLKLRVGGGNAGVDDVRASTRTCGAVVGVGSGTTSSVGDTSEAPGRRGLGDVCLLLERLRYAKVGLDNGILLNVVNLEGLSECGFVNGM